MRLLRVELSVRVPVRGHGDTATITSEMATLTYDPQTDMVAIGNDGDEVPRSRVIAWKRDRSRTPPLIKATCPECSREFNNASQLGSHRKQAHGVEGKTRRR